jgi:hypothetical protein
LLRDFLREGNHLKFLKDHISVSTSGIMHKSRTSKELGEDINSENKDQLGLVFNQLSKTVTKI